MPDSISTPLLLVLVGVAGILIGLLVSTIFKGDTKSNPDETQLPKKYADKGFAEAARLYYSPAVRKAITQLDGDFYPDFDALTPDQKKRVLRILQAWQEWSSQPQQPQPAAQGVTLPKLPDIQSEPEPIETNRNVSVQQLPELNPKNVKATTGEPIIAKPLSIFEQINEILEEVVANSPEKNRGIHLVDNGHEGVIVWVGLEKFNGVNEVPYPEVQALIRTAVARWEEEADAMNKLGAVSPKK
jgi:hypothetical protein